MDSAELAEHFGVAVEHLQETMDAAGWRYHKDANGVLWASDKTADQNSKATHRANTQGQDHGSV
jgi:hypothetical protein